MSRLLLLVLAAGVALPVAGQDRRVEAKAFPLSIGAYGALNGFGARAQEQDPVLGCITANCVEHGLTKGPGGGVELQAPLVGNIGVAVGLEAATMLRQQCIAGGNCSTSTRILGLRGRAQILFRLKARAPIYFGFGVGALRSDPGAIEGQSDGAITIGGAFSVGGDFPIGPRTSFRVTWNSYLLKTPDEGFGSSFNLLTAHDGSLTLGVRYSILP